MSFFKKIFKGIVNVMRSVFDTLKIYVIKLCIFLYVYKGRKEGEKERLKEIWYNKYKNDKVEIIFFVCFL